MNNKKFVSRFKDVNLYKRPFSLTSVRAVKEIYAEKFGLSKQDVMGLNFQVCLDKLREIKENKN
tara:strand:- start:324 stop:515 length:192 start_codon:yes stop_codon:yes gene_type:complete